MCADPEIFQFKDVPDGTTYTVKVTGPTGTFAATANHTDTNGGATHWPASALTNKTRTQVFGKGDKSGTHVVNYDIAIVSNAEIEVTLEAEVAGEKYCRKMKGKAPQVLDVLHLARIKTGTPAGGNS